MASIRDFASSDPVAWCPGCGNFGLLLCLKKALVALGKEPHEVLLVSGIGQAAKLPHYVKANCFNGLHGRALPVAAAAKMADRALTVIVTTGDGDCYGEGGNHFLHTIRRNVDITVIVHDNQIYGLTKGQASPTTELGHRTKVQVKGVALRPFQPLQVAISLGAGFAARGYVGQPDHLVELMVEGIRHRGFSLIDVLQPCVTFNRVNTYAWYAKRVAKVTDDPAYDPADRFAALKKAEEWGDRIPIGVIHRAEGETYEDRTGLSSRPPLVEDDVGNVDIGPALLEYR